MLTVDKNNIRWVYGMLRKFFYNKNGTGFLMWHNFDCGRRRKVSSIVKLNNHESVDVKREILKPSELKFEQKYIVINYGPSMGDILQIGDMIEFKSGRIKFRQKALTDRGYVYTVIQAKHLSDESIYYINERYEMDRMFQWADDDIDYEIYDPDDFEEYNELDNYHGE